MNVASSAPVAAPSFGPRQDIKAYELVLAVVVGLLVPAVSGQAMRWAGLSHMGAAPEIVPGDATAIRVKPVLDLSAPILRKGGKKVQYKLPAEWEVKAPPRAEPAAAEVRVSTRAKDDVAAIPASSLPMASPSSQPPDEADAGAPSVSTSTPGEGSDSGAPGSPEESGEGGGHPQGVPGGDTDDPDKALKDLHLAQYRGRLIGFFRNRFSGVHGTGLPKEELDRLSVTATVTIGADLTVTGFSMSSSGNAAFDAAARAALQSAVGSQVPPPPESLADRRLNSVSVQLVCQGRCS